MIFLFHRSTVGAGLLIATSVVHSHDSPSHNELSQTPTLLDIYHSAIDNNAKFRASKERYEANLEIEKQALAAVLPQISASGQYSKIDTDKSANQTVETLSGAFTTNVDDHVDSDSTSYSLSVNQSVFNLPLWYNYKRGKEISSIASAQFTVDQQDLIIRVAQAYFSVLRAQDNLEVSNAEERASKRRWEHANRGFEAGIVPITDVHEARAVYDLTVVARLSDEGSVDAAYEALTALTGQDYTGLWQLHNDFPVVDPSPVRRGDWVDIALQHSSVLKIASHNKTAAQHNSTAKKMEHAPKISAFYHYSDFNEDGDEKSDTTLTTSPFEFDNSGSVWGVQLDIPLYTGGSVSSQRRQAYKQYNAAFQQHIDTQRTVVKNTRDLHIAVTTDVQRVKARTQAIVSSSSALDATQSGYQAQTRTIVDVLQAQRTLYSSIRNYANSRYDYVMDLLMLKRAAGILSQDDLQVINKWIVDPAESGGSLYKKYLKD